MRHRLIATTIAAAVAATAALVGVGVTSASAASFRPIDVRMWAYMCDDEIIDRRDHCREYDIPRKDEAGKPTSKKLTVPGAVIENRCHGNEINLDVEMSSTLKANGIAEVTVDVWFDESNRIAGCWPTRKTDHDFQAVEIREGERKVLNFLWGKPQKGHDGVALQVILND